VLVLLADNLTNKDIGNKKQMSFQLRFSLLLHSHYPGQKMKEAFNDDVAAQLKTCFFLINVTKQSTKRVHSPHFLSVDFCYTRPFLHVIDAVS